MLTTAASLQNLGMQKHNTAVHMFGEMFSSHAFSAHGSEAQTAQWWAWKKNVVARMLADLSEAKRILPVLDLGEEAKSDLKAI